MSSKDDDMNEDEFQEADRWLRENEPELWQIAQEAEKPGFVRRVLRVLPKGLRADFVRDFAIECRASEIGGIRVIMRRTLTASSDPALVAKANRWLRRTEREQRQIMDGLTPEERKRFVHNVWQGAKEAESDLREELP